MNDTYTVQSHDLPSNMQHPDLLAPEPLPGASFESLMQDYKIKIALKAIEECKGNKTLAARSLQISRTYLHRLIKDPTADDESLALDEESSSVSTELETLAPPIEKAATPGR